MRRYLRQYIEAKDCGHTDERGDLVLISPRGIPVVPSCWLKMEFKVISSFCKLKIIIGDFKSRIFEI